MAETRKIVRHTGNLETPSIVEQAPPEENKFTVAEPTAVEIPVVETPIVTPEVPVTILAPATAVSPVEEPKAPEIPKVETPQIPNYTEQELKEAVTPKEKPREEVILHVGNRHNKGVVYPPIPFKFWEGRK